jgi:hypothetical protein
MLSKLAVTIKNRKEVITMREITSDAPSYNVVVGRYVGDGTMETKFGTCSVVRLLQDDGSIRTVIRNKALANVTNELIGSRIAVDRTQVGKDGKRITRVFLLEDGEEYVSEPDPFSE